MYGGGTGGAVAGDISDTGLRDVFAAGGTYLSLRVIIGEGTGHNWWCVVFPPLCTASETDTLEESAEKAGLSEENLALITQSDEEYVLKFKSVEMWETWTASLRK